MAPDQWFALLNGLLGGVLALSGSSLLEWLKTIRARRDREDAQLDQREADFNNKIVELLSISARRRGRIQSVAFDLTRSNPVKGISKTQQDVLWDELPDMESILYHITTIFGADTRAHDAYQLVVQHHMVMVNMMNAKESEEFKDILVGIMDREIVITNTYIALNRAEMAEKSRLRRYRPKVKLEDIPRPSED